ncbi:MAG TPA: GGDEF domain-containing protein [Candidatus Nanopelagicales bacterium]|nr:GGDEF domain-containing protein [Candidatus Nanopelagicales bacterium]
MTETTCACTGAHLWAVMNDGRPRAVNVFLHHKLGHRIPVSVKARPIRGPQGDIIGSVEVFTRRRSTRFAELAEVGPHEEAYIDPVTQIGNRRYAEAHLGPMLAPDGADSLGLVFVDIDHFKVVNDTWGHPTGDAVLRMVGQTLANGLRTADVPVRWGGDEFLVALPGITTPALARAAERLRMLVDHSWIDIDGEKVKVTVSAGAVMVRSDESIDDALARADALMYVSKRGGRDLVTGEAGPVARSDGSPSPLQITQRPADL